MNMLLNDLRRHTLASQSTGVGRCLLRDAVPEASQIEIAIEGDDFIPLPVADLNAILVQLIQNAVAHTARIVVISWDGGTMLVSDDGDGVDQGNHDRIFDPFFTSRRETGGTGMGLAVVRSLLSAHGGRIALMDSQHGAAFEIRLAG
jgi:signal transduction histidine kinase